MKNDNLRLYFSIYCLPRSVLIIVKFNLIYQHRFIRNIVSAIELDFAILL